jgi:hypothetical protein
MIAIGMAPRPIAVRASAVTEERLGHAGGSTEARDISEYICFQAPRLAGLEA